MWGLIFFKLLTEKKIGEQGFFRWGNLKLETTQLRPRFFTNNCRIVVRFRNWAGGSVEIFVEFFGARHG